MNVTDLPVRFQRRIQVEPSGCWRWTAGNAGKGYAYAHWDGGMAYVHRITYHLLIDPEMPVRGGGHAKCIDHLCANKGCVNPGHLELVPWAENVRRYYRSNSKPGAAA